MGAHDPTYVIFDGDNDQWAYRFMKGWNQSEHVAFDFRDAHDLTPMTSRAEDEAYVKRELRKRMNEAEQVIVIVGESTKNLRKFVPWEIELAIERNLPVIVANLNEERSMDPTFCPVALRNHTAVHVAFKARIINHALNSWPTEFHRLSGQKGAGGPHYYNDGVYKSLGL
jgi:hypothetical protein